VAKTKLKKFAELDTFSNVIQPNYQSISDNYPMRGQWSRAFFGNDNPVVLEIGCGKGEYTVSQALENPDKNFIGIDVKGERLWRGAKTSIEKGINNTAFIRMQAQKLNLFFAPNEVSEIWITFPDPQLQKPKTKKRLTAEKFLDIYKTILNEDGCVHLKTDNAFFFEFSVETIQKYGCNVKSMSTDIHGKPNEVDAVVTRIMTYYEEMYVKKGQPINYLKFAFKQ
jgi:tRNA (guanine-N7-)-methyltransferase